MKNFAGITLWPYILLKKAGVYLHANTGPYYHFEYSALVLHELCHFRQQERLWVVGFYVLYVGEFLVNLVKYRGWMKAYRNISFEVDARKAEG